MKKASRNEIGFCQNSKMWIGIMAFNPKSCPYHVADCHPNGCGYYEDREPNKYILRKMKILGLMAEAEVGN